jgi:hypothetical protein
MPIVIYYIQLEDEEEEESCDEEEKNNGSIHRLFHNTTGLSPINWQQEITTTAKNNDGLNEFDLSGDDSINLTESSNSISPKKRRKEEQDDHDYISDDDNSDDGGEDDNDWEAQGDIEDNVHTSFATNDSADDQEVDSYIKVYIAIELGDDFKINKNSIKLGVTQQSIKLHLQTYHRFYKKFAFHVTEFPSEIDGKKLDKFLIEQV